MSRPTRLLVASTRHVVVKQRRKRGEGGSILAFQIRCDFGELGEGGLEVFDDFGGDDVGIGEVRGVKLQTQPESWAL
jgi:hypothetical protein